MTLFHPLHHAAPRIGALHPIRPPAWIGRVNWARTAAVGLNLALWAGVVVVVRAVFRL